MNEEEMKQYNAFWIKFNNKIIEVQKEITDDLRKLPIKVQEQIYNDKEKLENTISKCILFQKAIDNGGKY